MEESKCCTNIMKKNFKKELVMTVKMMKIFKNPLTVGFVILLILRAMLK